MLLAIDIGNTNIVLGCIEDNKILFRERIYTNHFATDLEYAANLKTAMEMHDISPRQIDGGIISSVVPTMTATFSAAVRKLIGVEPMVVSADLKTDLTIAIEEPARLGSDLVVDAVAGIAEYPAPMIIIDMGTATTLSVIDENKRYIGGMIVTGMAVSADALISRTAQLPKFAFEKPDRAIGKNTVDCLKSGLMYSNACALDGMTERIEEELGQKCTIVATGGLAAAVVPLCRREIILDDDLLLKGLDLIYNKNS